MTQKQKTLRWWRGENRQQSRCLLRRRLDAHKFSMLVKQPFTFKN